MIQYLTNLTTSPGAPPPIGLGDELETINSYYYANVNPLVFLDPMGLLFEKTEIYIYKRLEQLQSESDHSKHWLGEFADVAGLSTLCFYRCMLGDTAKHTVLEPTADEAIKSGVKKHYTKKWPKKFKAGGESSKYWVPRATKWFKIPAKSLLWAWTLYDAYECYRHCTEKGICDIEKYENFDKYKIGGFGNFFLIEK